MAVERTEQRFEVSVECLDQLKILLAQTMIEAKHSPTEIETVYFLDDIGNTRHRFRLRIYHAADPLAFLEYKRERGGRNSKNRLRVDPSVTSALDKDQNPNSIAAFCNAETLKALAQEDIDGSTILKTGAVESRRHEFGDPESDSRVTLDTGERFFGYFGNDRSQRLIVGKSRNVKVEIKGSDEVAIERVKSAISEVVELKPLPDRELELKNLYLQMMYEQVVDRKSVNEVPDSEIEIKLEIEPDSRILDVTYERLLNGDDTWSTFETGIYRRDDRLINFGFHEEDSLHEGMVIVVDGLERGFGMKIKECATEQSGTLIRKETVEIHLRPFNDEEKEALQRKAEAHLAKPLTEIGEIAKTKKYIIIQSKLTGRFYKLCLDRCEFKGKTLHQIEIEYKGLPKGSTLSEKSKDELIKEITAEIETLADWLRSNSNLPLKVTSLTKFDWLGSLTFP